jgi:hypothetical protein
MMTTRRLPLIVAALIFTGLGVHFLPAAEEQQQPAVSVELLMQKIEVLEQRVAELEAWKKQQRQLDIAQLIEQKRQVIEPRTIPNSWKPFEFNGQTVYYVPLTGLTAPPAAEK